MPTAPPGFEGFDAGGGGDGQTVGDGLLAAASLCRTEDLLPLTAVRGNHLLPLCAAISSLIASPVWPDRLGQTRRRWPLFGSDCLLALCSLACCAHSLIPGSIRTWLNAVAPQVTNRLQQQSALLQEAAARPVTRLACRLPVTAVAAHSHRLSLVTSEMATTEIAKIFHHEADGARHENAAGVMYSRVPLIVDDAGEPTNQDYLHHLTHHVRVESKAMQL